ncbi:unnamed protein product, partial [Ectocarpus sp. 13 AM-2016]
MVCFGGVAQTVENVDAGLLVAPCALHLAPVSSLCVQQPHDSKNPFDVYRLTGWLDHVLWKHSPVRLYVKGVMLGFKRGLRNTYHHTSL